MEGSTEDSTEQTQIPIEHRTATVQPTFVLVLSSCKKNQSHCCTDLLISSCIRKRYLVPLSQFKFIYFFYIRCIIWSLTVHETFSSIISYSLVQFLLQFLPNCSIINFTPLRSTRESTYESLHPH